MVLRTTPCSPTERLRRPLHPSAFGFCLLLAAIVPTGPARAQAPPAPPVVGDTVRVHTLLAVTTGEVLFVCQDSLIIRHRDSRFLNPLTLSRTMLIGLDVKLGRRSRWNAALLGAAAGAAMTGAMLVSDKIAAGPGAHWGALHPADNAARLMIFGPTVGGAIIGLSLPGARWRTAALPGDAQP